MVTEEEELAMLEDPKLSKREAAASTDRGDQEKFSKTVKHGFLA